MLRCVSLRDAYTPLFDLPLFIPVIYHDTNAIEFRHNEQWARFDTDTFPYGLRKRTKTNPINNIANKKAKLE